MAEGSGVAIAVMVIIFSLAGTGLYFYFTRKIALLEASIPERARQQFQEWQGRELEAVRLQQRDVARREAQADVEMWKVEYEATIRADAIMRSQAVITGKVTENLVPYMPVFPYNPKDVRFIGSPVDLLVFDGAAEGSLRSVIFLEVKTGSSALNHIQRQIRDAVIAGKVQWRELRLMPNK